jgi:hypothetical protein
MQTAFRRLLFGAVDPSEAKSFYSTKLVEGEFRKFTATTAQLFGLLFSGLRDAECGHVHSSLRVLDRE